MTVYLQRIASGRLVGVTYHAGGAESSLVAFAALTSSQVFHFQASKPLDFLVIVPDFLQRGLGQVAQHHLLPAGAGIDFSVCNHTARRDSHSAEPSLRIELNLVAPLNKVRLKN